MNEKFNLTWYTFQTHTNELLSDLYKSSKYSDVTLVCEDKSQFKAHKFVLSSCSSVFEDIFTNNDNLPCLYLRGILKEEMESILQFMYLGEATFYEERMNEFLKVARDLDMKEIGKDIDLNEDGNIDGNKHSDLTNDVQAQQNLEPVYERQIPESGIVPLEVRNENGIYKCHECEFGSSFSANLKRHIKSVHEGVKYPCQSCEYQATDPSTLNRHNRRDHSGIRYPCQQCNFQATR